MTFEEYKKWVEGRVSSRKYHLLVSRPTGLTRYNDPLRALAALGLGGEAGEVVDVYKKYLFHGRDLNRDDLRREIGDVLWYLALMMLVEGFTLDEVINCNVKRLTERDGEKMEKWEEART